MAVPAKVRERAESLRREIETHNHRYYVLDAPTIPDAEYDRLFKELQQLEHRYPELVSADSPTQRVGGAAQTTFSKVVHRVPMLSIRNEGAQKFDERCRKALGSDEVENKIERLCISFEKKKPDLIRRWRNEPGQAQPQSSPMERIVDTKLSMEV